MDGGYVERKGDILVEMGVITAEEAGDHNHMLLQMINTLFRLATNAPKLVK